MIVATPDLSIRITAEDDTGSVFRGLEQKVSALSVSFGAIGKTFVGAKLLQAGEDALLGLKESVTGILGEMAKLDDAAERSGASVETLSGVLQALKPSGASLESITELTEKIVRGMQGAGDDSKKFGEAFAALGIKTRDSNGNLRDSGQVLIEVAQKLGTYADGANKTALAQAILGKGGSQFLPILKDLAEAGNLQAIVTTQQAAQAEALEKSWGRLKISGEAWKVEMLSGIIPALTELANQLNIARAAGLSFWGALQTIPGANTTKVEQIRATEKEIADLTEQRDKYLNAKGPTKLFASTKAEELDRKIRDATSHLKVLRDQLVALHANDPLDPNEGAAPKPKAPKLLGDSSKKAGEIEKAFAELEKARTQISVEAEQKMAAFRLGILDRFHADGLLSEQDYWDARATVQSSAYQAERDALTKQVDVAAKLQSDQAKRFGANSKEYAEATKGLVEAQGKRNALDAAFAAQGASDFYDKAKAAKEYTDALVGISAQIADLSGDPVTAALARFDQQFEKLKQRAVGQLFAANDITGLDQIATLRSLTEAQAAFNAEKEKASVIEQTLASAESRVQTDVLAGILSESESMKRLGELRTQAADQLAVIAQRQREIAAASGNPKLLSDADAFDAKLKQLAQSSDVLGNKVRSTFVDGVSNAFADVVTGAKSASDAVRDFATATLREFARLAANKVATSLWQTITGIPGIAGPVGAGEGSAATGYTPYTADQAAAAFKAKALPSPSASAMALSPATGSASTKSVGSSVVVQQHIYPSGGASYADVANAGREAKDAAKVEIAELIRRRRLVPA